MSEYIVNTTSGAVRGILRDGLVEYLGIPYAKPPVGALRFRRAQAVEPWDGVFDAVKYGPEAIQNDEGVDKGSENCLTLNIQRPAEGEKLPVFVYIHGGGYTTGAACVPLYNGKHFAEEGLVFVSFQYRMSVLGFYDFTTYPGGEEFESNCGLSDQILAMRWIHENIAAFGGDPENVTINGESAGGASVVNMLAIPAVKGFFQNAIVQSGLANCGCSPETARQNMDLYLEGMGMTEADLPKLKTMDPFEMLKGINYVAERHQYKNPGMYLPGPVIDDLLPERPIDAIRHGSAAGVKLIIGTNLQEGTMFVHPEKTGFPNSWAMVAEMMEKNGHAEAIPRIIDYYHPSKNDRFTKFRAQAQFSMSTVPPITEGFEQEGAYPFISFATDYAFQMPSVKVAEAQRQYTKDVWMYRYEYITRSGWETGWLASHAFELPLSFGNMDFHFSQFVFQNEPEETVQNLIREIHGSWVRFAKCGDPNPDWLRFAGYDSPVRIFDRESRTVRLDRTELMRVWDDLRFYEE
ncbi:MAG: carboxylesterase/lipase family protein [Lachnospiraceae bacterium]|nr:carboxylesterase/lipase family protein [Lachnospiraceae bacterium]